MALGTPAVIPGQQGQTTMRPNGIVRMQFAGDAAYVADGSAGFAAVYLRAELGRDVNVTQVVGYGRVADVITHIAHYVTADDKLKVYLLATGVEVGDSDISSSTFDVEVHYR